MKTTAFKKNKTRKCAVKGCQNRFMPRNMLHKACSQECAEKVAQNIRVEDERKDFAVRKEALKSRSDHLKEAQSIFNAFIRLRDADLPCISCQRHHKGQYDAGHYLAVGSHPELRFEELNNHKQCSPCNRHLSGNQFEYRKNLILKIGLDRVEWLESKHDPKKYTIQEIIEIKRVYKLKYKELHSRI
jgi:hypothetical protein